MLCRIGLAVSLLPLPLFLPYVRPKFNTITNYDTKSTVNFNVTIPSTLGDKCGTAGKCAIQWYWYATKNKQTYESCVDFYIA